MNGIEQDRIGCRMRNKEEFCNFLVVVCSGNFSMTQEREGNRKIKGVRDMDNFLCVRVEDNARECTPSSQNESQQNVVEPAYIHPAVLRLRRTRALLKQGRKCRMNS